MTENLTVSMKLHVYIKYDVACLAEISYMVYLHGFLNY
jgi:hypothetical protein